MAGSVQDRVAQLISKRLRSIALGALSMLNNIAFRKYRADFASLLLNDPLKAYEVLLEYSRGDRRRARLFLRSVLVAVIPPNRLLGIINALENGDPEPLLRELESLRRGEK